jgi:hypothetical protein
MLRGIASNMQEAKRTGDIENEGLIAFHSVKIEDLGPPSEIYARWSNIAALPDHAVAERS